MTAARSVLTRTRTVSTIYPKTSRNTVVTLLGWAYGRDENLAKYSQIYENRGFTTLRFTAQFAGHTRNLKCSRNVSGVIDSIRNILSESDKRLSLHLLSMNGVYTLCSLLLQYPELNILNRTSGIVFDSCPIYFDSTSASAFGELADTFAAKTLSSGRPVEIAMYRLWKAYFMLNVRIAVYELLLYSKVGFDLTNISPYHFVREHPLLPHNLAFIYSDKDTICPAHSIEAFHRTMSEMGKNVISHRFIDSPHVEHFKKYPKEYESIVDQYLGFLEN